MLVVLVALVVEQALVACLAVGVVPLLWAWQDLVALEVCWEGRRVLEGCWEGCRMPGAVAPLVQCWLPAG